MAIKETKPKAVKEVKEIKAKAIEETLWDSANKLRGSVESAEYKHVVLGLIFLKFASDKFEQHRAALIAKVTATVGRLVGVMVWVIHALQIGRAHV